MSVALRIYQIIYSCFPYKKKKKKKKKKTGMFFSVLLEESDLYSIFCTKLGLQTTCNCKHTFYEHVREKINNFGFRPGQTQTGLYNHDA